MVSLLVSLKMCLFMDRTFGLTWTASRWRKSRQDLILKLEEIAYTMVAAWFFEDNGDVVCLQLKKNAVSSPG